MKYLRFLLLFLGCVSSTAAQIENELISDDSLKLNELFDINSMENLEQLEQLGKEKNNFEKGTKTTEQFLNFQIESIIKDGSEGQGTKGTINDPFSESDPTTPNRTLYQRLATGPSQYDSRIELLELSLSNEWERQMLTCSKSVAMIVHKDQLWELTDSLFSLDISSTLAKRLNVCPEEAYAGQISVGVGTAFVIGEDSMMTANHVFEESMENYVVVFNYQTQNRKGAINPIIPASDLYHIKKVFNENDLLDVVCFQVDRKLSVPALTLSPGNDVQEDQMVYMIGHPSGLPKKVALNARVHNNSFGEYFYTTLDAFQGNSGSPVFSLSKNEVIGVLVSGEQDFYWTGNCNTSTLCEIPYCLGEKVIRIEQAIAE